MTMESSKKMIPYFDTCGSCEGYFAKHTSTIEICSMCFDKIAMDLWGYGVPTEQDFNISTHLRLQCVPNGGGSNEILPP